MTSTLLSSARQTFPSGLTPAVKDCCGLHGHYAFGSVAKEKSGVGRKSDTSDGLTTDLVHWLQAGKTVAVVRFASKFHRLASAFRTDSVATLPATGRLPASACHRAAVVILRIHRSNSEDSVGLHQSERQWLLDGLTPIGVPLSYIKTTERSLSIYSIGAIEDLETFDYSRLRRNFASVICEGQCKAFVVGHSLRPTASVQCEGDKAVSFGRKAAQRASFPPCWVYHAHQCRRSRHRRAHSCCRS